MRVKFGIASARRGRLGPSAGARRPRGPQDCLEEEISRLGGEVLVDDPETSVPLPGAVPIVEEEEPVHPRLLDQDGDHVLVIPSLVSLVGPCPGLREPERLVVYAELPHQRAERRLSRLVPFQSPQYNLARSLVVVVVYD